MNRPNDIEITDRQRHILAIIVEQYVSTARPVASEHIIGHYDLNVSSATVRNEMVELEKAGLISQPHTSAGRAPTDQGYRFFVENLMTPSTLPINEQRKIRHQFHQIEMDADEWVRLATSVLARTVNNVAVATAPRSSAVRLKHFELISISDKRVLLVMVGHDGTVTQQLLTVEEDLDQERLSSLAAQLNGVLDGKTSTEIAEWSGLEQNTAAQPAFVRDMLVPVMGSMLARMERPETSHIYHEGLSHVLQHPEFHQPERIQKLLELLEHGGVWSSLITSALHQDGVQIIIGDEGSGSGIQQVSVVLARYGLEDRMTGVLGVIGPTRMPYSRSISSVQYMSQLLSDLLHKTYNSQITGGDS